MRVIEKNVYKFEELTEDAQQKVIEYFQNNNDFYYDADYDKEILKEKGFTNTDIYYDVSYCQGSGACFDGRINVPFFLDAFFEYTTDMSFIRRKTVLVSLVNDYASFSINANSFGWHYNHEKTRYIDYDYNDYCGYRLSKLFVSFLKEFVSFIEDARLTESKELFQRIRTEYEYQNSVEAIKEMIACNEYEFYEDGTLF